MSIDQYVAFARQELTGESVRAARQRVKQLPDWASLIPVATKTQQLLESLLASRLGAPGTATRYPLGIAEVVPMTSRLEIRLEHAGLVRPALALLPHRRRDRRAVQGVPELLARATVGSIEMSFARNPDAGVVALSSLDGHDLSDVLAEHATDLIGDRRVPLWTIDPSNLPPLPFPPASRRRKPKPPTLTQLHAHTAGIPSALLRRVRLFDRLAGHLSLRITAEEGEHSLRWHLTREVHPDCSPHDARLIELFADPIAGPGLVSDLDGHACDARGCSMTFTAADGQSSLRVESMLAAVAAPLVPRPSRHLTALGERSFLTHTAARRTSDIEAGSRPPAPPTPEAGGQARGHCVHLLTSRYGMDSRDLHHTATQIAAAWALEGYAVLVVQDSLDPAPARQRQVQGAAVATPSSMLAPEAAPFVPHRPLRLFPGSGSLSAQTNYGGRKATAALLDEARRQFDWILFVGCDDTFGMGIRIEESADSYVVVVSTRTYDEYIVTTQARDGVAEHLQIPVSAAASAIAW
ncbi:hypothetical protein [Streptomyces sp. NPDC004291]